MKGTPNFSVILPGKCNCRCDFCFWKYEKSPDTWLKQLKRVIKALPREYTRCSISGGEPTLSPVLKEAVKIIADSRKWEAIVLTTNGTQLLEKMDHIAPIHHLNLSRHHHLEKKNQEIFNTKSVPGTLDIVEMIHRANNIGIDVNLNCVLTDQFESKKDVEDYIRFAKTVGAQSVCFRQDQVLNSVEKPKEMEWFSDIKYQQGWACEVCKIYNQIISGMRVSWKSAYAEPSLTTGEIYELVYHQNGILSSDWQCKNVIVYAEGNGLWEMDFGVLEPLKKKNKKVEKVGRYVKDVYHDLDSSRPQCGGGGGRCH